MDDIILNEFNLQRKEILSVVKKQKITNRYLQGAFFVDNFGYAFYTYDKKIKSFVELQYLLNHKPITIKYGKRTKIIN